MAIFDFLGSALFAGIWLLSLISGEVCIGGSPWKLHYVYRRKNPAAYFMVMALLGMLALFAFSLGVGELR